MSTAASTEIEVIGARVAADRRPAVLIVDDSNANLTALEALLSALDVDVVRAASGDDALKQVLRRDFAVVLMDVQMPELDGFQTTALIRQRDRSRHTPIIFLTAIFKDEASAKQAYALGAVDYLTKPFDDEVLKAKVAALASHYRQADLVARQAEALRSKEQEAAREHAAREVAEAENRTKDEFLAILSHELRAPLNAILGWASLLKDEPNLSARAAKGVDAIVRNAHAQSRLVDDLLDASQLVAHTLTIESQPVDLAIVTQSAIATMQPAAGARRIRVDLDVAPGDYELSGDARRLEQLVCSLLSNAIKFSPADGVVTVELLRGGAGLQLRVKDAGVGISPELLPHVFEAFRQSDGSWTRRHGGLGLGLTMARHLAELHGGTVEAFSAGEGRGAVFVLTLPPAGLARVPVVQSNGASKAPDRAPAETIAEAPTPLAGLRILVVDDDADARELLAMLLTDAGATVATAASAREAVEHFENGAFEVLLSDLGMPDEDGLSLVKTIRRLDAKRGGSLVGIALSGYGSADDRQRSAQAGFDAHLTKPCDRRNLIASIARLTKRPLV
jgi:signal transduction histidine kinase